MKVCRTFSCEPTVNIHQFYDDDTANCAQTREASGFDSSEGTLHSFFLPPPQQCHSPLCYINRIQCGLFVAGCTCNPGRPRQKAPFGPVAFSRSGQVLSHHPQPFPSGAVPRGIVHKLSRPGPLHCVFVVVFFVVVVVIANLIPITGRCEPGMV